VLTAVLLGLLWFLLFVVGHIGLFHFYDIRQRSRAILAFFVAALIGLLVCAALLPENMYIVGDLPSPRFVRAVIGTVVMLCAFVVYMPAYYVFNTSLSVQTLIAIQQAPDHSRCLRELQSVDVYEQLLRRRLESMVAAGHLAADGQAYRLTPGGKRIATIFQAVKSLWRLGPGG